MKIKEGVILSGLDIRMRPALIKASEVWVKLNQELVVTCGLDGGHSASSYHYYGLALDFRTNYFGSSERILAKSNLAKALSEIDYHFDVVLEATHIHVEYDLNKAMK